MIERREEEEKEKGVQHGHAAGAEKEQEGDGVWAETRQGEGRDAWTREAAEDQSAGSGGTKRGAYLSDNKQLIFQMYFIATFRVSSFGLI